MNMQWHDHHLHDVEQLPCACEEPKVQHDYAAYVLLYVVTFVTAIGLVALGYWLGVQNSAAQQMQQEQQMQERHESVPTMRPDSYGRIG